MPIQYPNNLSRKLDNFYKSSHTIVVDVDDTICWSQPLQYDKAVVIPASREYLNKFYNDGWNVIYFTARYFRLYEGNIDKITGRGYNELRWWLEENGFLYSEIYLGKPSAFRYVDNNAFRVDNLAGERDWQVLSQELQQQAINWERDSEL